MWRLVFLAIGFSATLAAEPLTAFTTDGCSHFPNGTQSQPELWLDCCIAHDAAYWAGGSRAQRKLADKQLRQCLAQKQEAAIGRLMYLGVRVGGAPYWPSSFRWGYGWPYGRGYQALSDAEKQQVRKLWPKAVPLPDYLHGD